MRSAAFLLLPALAAAGCKPVPTAADNAAEAARAAQAAFDPAKIWAERWNGLFGDPAKIVATANEFEFTSTPYAAKGETGVFAASGKAPTFPHDPKAPFHVDASLSVMGDTLRRADMITFAFDTRLTGPLVSKADREPTKGPNQIVGGFLRRFDLYVNEDIRRAIDGASSAMMRQSIGRVEVVSTKRDDGAHIEVTISDTGGTPPSQLKDKALRK